MEMMLPDGRIIQVKPITPAHTPTPAKKRDRCKKPGEFAQEQPWLADHLANGLVNVEDAKGHLKQALEGVQCQAGNLVKYTSVYQEMDRIHAVRTTLQRELRTADFTHLQPCINVLGAGGFLRTSDFFQTFLCGRCQVLVKKVHERAIKAASRALAIKQLDGG